MPLHALRFSTAADRTPERWRLSPENRTTLAHSIGAARPVAFLLTNADVEALSSRDALADVLVDRGRKHPARGLKSLLLGRDRMPLIRGSYRDAGQLARSLRTLLDNARNAEERQVYLIGAEAGLFEALWEEARTRPSNRSDGGGDAPPGDGGESPPGSDPALLDLLDVWDVPPALTERFVGLSREAQLVRQLVLRAAESSEPVLILGETGTGKELVARSIHDFGPRRAERFTAVNCGAIPADLLESELFGHERGAFTSAVSKKVGLWKITGRGTLFLDEVADLHKGHQAKILRALQEDRVRPVGAADEIAVHARILAATNRDLYAMVRAGEFREDLYYRLRAFTVRTPSLRENPEDIEVLAEFFWRRITGRARAGLPASVAERLQARHWPGNTRELRAMLANLHALFGADRLDARRVSAVLRLQGYDDGREGPRTLQRDVVRLREREQLLRIEDLVRACLATLDLLGSDDGEAVAGRVREGLRRRMGELRSIAYAVPEPEPGVRTIPEIPEAIRNGLDALRAGLVHLTVDLELRPDRPGEDREREVRRVAEDVLEKTGGRLAVLDQG